MRFAADNAKSAGVIQPGLDGEAGAHRTSINSAWPSRATLMMSAS